MTRVETIESFLLAGRSVCPFARSSAHHFVQVSSTPRFDRKQLVRAAREFQPTRGSSPFHALIIVADKDGSYEETRRWSLEAYLELNVACALVTASGTTSMAAIERDIYGRIQRLLVDEGDPRRPHMLLGGESPLSSLITICMAPVYPENHPRYSPHMMLVATWHTDVGQMQTRELTFKIREKAQAAHGGEYDGDELMLHWPYRRNRWSR